MDEIKNVIKIARDVVEHVQDAPEWNDDNLDTLKHISDYYRLRVDNNKEVFSSELPEYVQDYDAYAIHENIVSIPDEHEVPTFLVKEVIGFYREWAFLYGFRNSNPENHQIDKSEYSGEQSAGVIEMMNRRITVDGINAQEVFVGLRIAYEALQNSALGTFEDPEEYLTVAQAVSNEVEEYLQTARENTNTEFNWNHLGASFDFTYNELHHEGIRRNARIKLAEELKNEETSIEDVLEERSQNI